MSVNFTINTSMLTKYYDSEYLNERDEKCINPNQFKMLGKKKEKSESTGKRGRDYKQFEIINNGDQESK